MVHRLYLCVTDVEQYPGYGGEDQTVHGHVEGESQHYTGRDGEERGEQPQESV